MGLKDVLRDVGRDLYPTWQAGLQDAQFLATRMTLDAPAGHSVPGQAGVPTSREAHETIHGADDWRSQVEPPAGYAEAMMPQAEAWQNDPEFLRGLDEWHLEQAQERVQQHEMERE